VVPAKGRYVQPAYYDDEAVTSLITPSLTSAFPPTLHDVGNLKTDDLSEQAT